MNAKCFDHLTRNVPAMSTRRGLLRALMFGSGLAAVRAPETLPAKAKNGKEKLKRNGFGCVNVDGACRGRNSVCCSGICDGKKPKKGEKDKSRCLGHHQGICTPADRGCSDDVPRPCNPDRPFAFCSRTTGHAGFCGDDVINGCIPCQKDADCVRQVGQGAACVVCQGCPGGATCALPGID